MEMRLEKKLSTAIKIGHLPYLNSEIFYRGLPPTSCSLTTMPPRSMASAVESSILQGGPLPVAEVFRLNTILRPIADLGVAVTGPAQSVFLFSNHPIEHLDGRPISITSDTATSVQLLRVLASDLWGIEPILLEPTLKYDAQLLIGDEAIKVQAEKQFRYVTDLGQSWYELTGLPFVFALWVLRRDVPAVQAKEFENCLTESFLHGRNLLNTIANERATSFMNEDTVKKYISHFTYEIGVPEKKGTKEFQLRLNRLPQWSPETISLDKI